MLMKRLVVALCGVVSLVLTVVAWTTVRDRPLSREYIEVMERARNLSPEVIYYESRRTQDPARLGAKVVGISFDKGRVTLRVIAL